MLVLILVLAAGAYAQESRGTIVGRVTDPSGSVVPRATIRITSAQTGITSTLSSNERGSYYAPLLNSGLYTISVEKEGFRPSTGEVRVQVGDRLEVNIKLQLSGVSETVEVEDDTPLLDTASGSIGQVIDSRQITDLPVPHGNLYALVQLAAGVTFAGSPAFDRPFEPTNISGYAMAGVRANRSELSLDGSPNTSTAGNNEVTAAYVPPSDVVGEFKVQTATFDAAVGQTEGGSINISLKTGGNVFHGTAQYMMMPPALSANLFFANRNRLPPSRFTYQRWGTSSTGPVLIPHLYNGRKRTFYVYGYEGIHETRPRGTTLTVPTEAERRGDFSQLLKLGAQYQIYDPYTRRTAPNGRTQVDPLAGNLIPAGRLSPVGLNILKYYALPTVPGTTDGSNNLPLPNEPERTAYYTHTARLDHYLGDRQRLFARANLYKRDSHYNDWFHSTATGEYYQLVSRAAAIDDVYTLTPSSVLNVRYGYNRFLRVTDSAPESRGLDLTTLGFSSAYTNAIDAGIRRFPYVTIAGYASTHNGMLFRPTETHTFNANVDRIVRLHSVKVGGEYRVYRENQYNYDNVSTGYFDFSTTWTHGPYDNSASSPIGQGLASLLFGLPSSGYVERRDSYAEQSTVWSLFVQDSWRLRRRLTVNLGVRYELEGPITERFNRSVRGFDPDVVLPIEEQVRARYAGATTKEVPPEQFRVRGGVNFAGVNGQPRTLWRRDKNNFMPRFGFAWSLRPKTVLRGGYGIFFGFLGERRGDVIQASFVQRTTLVPSIDSGLTFPTKLSDPYPSGFLAPAGSSLGPMTYAGQAVSFFNARPLAPYMQRWQLSTQNEFPHRIVLDIGYIGNRGTHVTTYRNLNAIPNQYLSTSYVRDDATINYLTASLRNPFYPLLPSTSRSSSSIARVDLLRRFPQFTSVTTSTNEGFSWYHAAYASVQTRYFRGWSLQAAFTWSKFMEATSFLNEGDPRPVHVVSDQDYPLRLTLSWVYELPFGPRKKFVSGARGLAAKLVGGWQVSGIYAAQSGQALSFGNIIFYGRLKDVPLPNGQRTVERWFNTAAGFERDARKALAYNLRALSPRFTGIRGDGLNNFDLSLSKMTRVRKERMGLQFRADFLNALNHAAFSNPNTDPTSTAFGTITTQKNYARRVQMALRLIY